MRESMVILSVLHKAPADSLAPILAEGLRYVTSVDPSVAEQRTNEYLDRLCRDQLRIWARSAECIYCYLGVDRT